jgi:hypothetical protein
MPTYTYNWENSGIVNSAGEAQTVRCEFDYSPAEPQTNDDPGCPASLTLYEAWLGDYNLAPMLDEDDIIVLEGEAALRLSED